MTHPTPDAAPHDTTWAVIAHLSPLIAFVGVPGLVGPLVVWLVKRTDDPFAAGEAKEALNFHLSLLIYGVGLGVLALLALGTDAPRQLIPIGLAYVAMLVGSLVYAIVAAVRASGGEPYRYPLTLRLV